ERQRTRDRLENSADLIAAGLLRGIASVGDTLARLVALHGNAGDGAAERVAARLPRDALLLLATADRFEAYPRGRLLYDPLPRRATEPAAAIFARGDSLEFRARNPSAAGAVYRELARSRDASVRAAALLRLGRATRKANTFHLAAAAYDELAQLDDAIVNGLPASLVASAARVALLSEPDGGDTAILRRDATELHDALHAGRWRIPRSAFAFYDAEASRALALSPMPHGDVDVSVRIALSDAAASAWTEWRADNGEPLPATGARSVQVGDHALLLVWSARGDRIAALVAGPAFLQDAMLSAVAPLLERQQVRLALADDANRLVVASGTASPAGARVSRPASETRLPWTLHVSAAGGADAAVVERRRLLIAGIVVAGLLALFGTYAVSRAANRELSAARLQADFVAAVSHEFRTPLTSLRQLTELLASGRVASPERRTEYYGAMQRETARLHRFVESLLDFGRADAGAAERRTESLDGVALVRDTVAEFERDTAAGGVTIELTAPPAAGDACVVRGDAEALRRALWNLLDNAVKYSPDERVVQVRVACDGTTLAIVVRDRGIGIPAGEQTSVFEKFERGAAARERGIRGTGIGLAIVRQVVEAHDGVVSVESAPGAGSTFTITLPVAAA
ncbi:MAG: HAMP domain-containing sensor histidine kinase, partial [Gemmatimonadaceae bacterium]